MQAPAGGPNFYQFGDDVRYEIHIDNDGDGKADITYRFTFSSRLRNPETFLYNTGPIKALNSPNWNSRQFYSVRKLMDNGGTGTELGKNLACPPCNIGPLSTPNYANLAASAVHDLGRGIRVFAGQRAEGFYVDLGAIFDLGDLRPFENLHNQYGMNVFSGPAPGVNATNKFNVHSIAIQVPIRELVQKGASGESDPKSVIGVWTTASRQSASAFDEQTGKTVNTGPYRQVSRLGNPLINEVIIALGDKDRWNALPPAGDKQFAHYYAQPGLAAALPSLYPGVFPNLAALVAVRQGAGRPGSDPAHRDPQRDHPELPEQHRLGPVRHAPAQHGDPAVEQPEHPRAARRGPRRVPQRPPRVRRHRHGRTAGRRGPDLRPGGQQLHAGRAPRARSPTA